MDAGHNTMNHFVQKIISRYPLEIYLIRRFFPIHFQLRPNLAESAYFVLYLAEALNPFRKQGEILIVSNQPISILNTLKTDSTKYEHVDQRMPDRTSVSFQKSIKQNNGI